MRILLKYFYLLSLLLSSQVLLAQVTFQATISKQNVPLNENLTVEFAINEDGDFFQAPPFKDFNVVGGPNTSISATWINGKKSFNKSYSFVLRPTKKGKFTIGSASIEVNGQKYQTQPVTVNIVDPVKRESQENSLNQIQKQSLETIHLVAEVSNRNPYVNEPITISYKIFFREGLSGYAGKKIPTFDKFWVHNVKVPEPQPIEGTYNNEPYYYILIKQDVLMAQEVGTFEIDPLVLDVHAQILTGRRDFFGFPEYGNIEKEFSTNKIVINTKALPTQDQPSNFSGAVGDFNFKAVPNKRELKAGELLNLKVEVSGRGNLNLLKMPTPTANSALEIYDPVYSEKLSTGLYGIQGSRTNNYTIIPQYQGEYTIDPMEFSYFDLASKTYKTITTDSIKINVLEGPTLPTNKDLQDPETLQENDLFQNIKTSFSQVNPQVNKYWGSTLFYLLNALPFLGVLVLLIASKLKQNALKDTQGNRLKAKSRLAKKYLSQAKKHTSDKDKFYEALELCLHNFLKAKLHIETSEMSNETIIDLLEKNQVDSKNIHEFIALKNACEWARYTPSEQVNINGDYHNAIEILAQLEKQIK
ncbi:BatD family protein [Myroides sp. LJL119]